MLSLNLTIWLHIFLCKPLNVYFTLLGLIYYYRVMFHNNVDLIISAIHDFKNCKTCMNPQMCEWHNKHEEIDLPTGYSLNIHCRYSSVTLII